MPSSSSPLTFVEDHERWLRIHDDLWTYHVGLEMMAIHLGRRMAAVRADGRWMLIGPLVPNAAARQELEAEGSVAALVVATAGLEGCPGGCAEGYRLTIERFRRKLTILLSRGARRERTSQRGGDESVSTFSRMGALDPATLRSLPDPGRPARPARHGSHGVPVHPPQQQPGGVRVRLRLLQLRPHAPALADAHDPARLDDVGHPGERRLRVSALSRGNHGPGQLARARSHLGRRVPDDGGGRRPVGLDQVPVDHAEVPPQPGAGLLRQPGGDGRLELPRRAAAR